MDPSMSSYVPYYISCDLIHTPSKTPPDTAFTNVEPLHLRKKLQQARVAQCMSIMDVANRIGCEPKLVSEYEDGTAVISEELKAKLIKVFRLQ